MALTEMCVNLCFAFVSVVRPHAVSVSKVRAVVLYSVVTGQLVYLFLCGNMFAGAAQAFYSCCTGLQSLLNHLSLCGLVCPCCAYRSMRPQMTNSGGLPLQV